MPHDPDVVGLPEFEVERTEGPQPLVFHVRYTGLVSCPFCKSEDLRKKSRYVRKIRHENFGQRRCFLYIVARKYRCLGCGRYFNQRFPGIGLYRRNTEPFRRQIVYWHREGISQKSLSRQERIGTATVERWYHDFLERASRERQDAHCPRVLGIDEHFFTRDKGYATTLCDLARHRIFDVVLGRSEKALEGYFSRLAGKSNVRVVCMDLSSTYRSIIRRFFPNALIVSDRFHVIRLVNQQFLAVWGALDPKGRAHRGLLSLVRRHPKNLKPHQVPTLNAYLDEHPAFRIVYEFKQRLVRLLLIKHRTKRHCRRLVPLLLEAIRQLKASPFAPLATLGETFDSWKEEIARMWRFTKSNGITEGFHTKMEMISRRAFGFRNFENYRLRVKVLCA